MPPCAADSAIPAGCGDGGAVGENREHSLSDHIVLPKLVSSYSCNCGRLNSNPRILRSFVCLFRSSCASPAHALVYPCRLSMDFLPFWQSLLTMLSLSSCYFYSPLGRPSLRLSPAIQQLISSWQHLSLHSCSPAGASFASTLGPSRPGRCNEHNSPLSSPPPPPPPPPPGVMPEMAGTVPRVLITCSFSGRVGERGLWSEMRTEIWRAGWVLRDLGWSV